MSILSLEFLVFCGLTIALNYIIPLRFRWILLLASSMVFYTFAGWQSMVWMVAVSFLAWGGALKLGRLRTQEKAFRTEGDKAAACKYERARKGLQAILICLIVGAMVFVKYLDAGRHGLKALLTLLEVSIELPTFAVLVPLGLSYFTFQSAGYVIDVGRGKIQPERNPLRFLLFVSFFPQITQGPIDNWKHLAPQLAQPKRFEPEFFTEGFQLMLWGYFKKMVIADRLVPVTTAITSGESQPGWMILLGVTLYMIRLYADFSGGMDVIRGLAKMLGIDVAENFCRPFFSTSVAEYWRRWHISLGAWFRNYVFYPITISCLGLACGKAGRRLLGKKAGRMLPGAVATVLIFVLIGMWHGASCNAAIFGGYFGLLMGGSMLLEPLFKWVKGKLHLNEKMLLWKAFCLLRTLVLVLLAQYFAVALSTEQAWALLCNTFDKWAFASTQTVLTDIMPQLEWYIAAAAMLIMFAVDLLCECRIDVNGRLARTFFLIRWFMLIFLILSILIFGCYGEGANAAAFLYTQF